MLRFTDGSKIESTLKGSWLAGTTKTYKLSEKNSTWEYTLETTNPANVAYNQDKSNDYLVTSYRIAPDGTSSLLNGRQLALRSMTVQLTVGLTWAQISLLG